MQIRVILLSPFWNSVGALVWKSAMYIQRQCEHDTFCLGLPRVFKFGTCVWFFLGDWKSSYMGDLDLYFQGYGGRLIT